MTEQIPSSETLAIAMDIDLAESTEPHIFNPNENREHRVVAEYTSPTTNDKTAWSLPWNTEGVIELRDQLNNMFRAATENGFLSYFSVDTEDGELIMINANATIIPENEVRGQLFW